MYNIMIIIYVGTLIGHFIALNKIYTLNILNLTTISVQTSDIKIYNGLSWHLKWRYA